jgi:hypothetical protein
MTDPDNHLVLDHDEPEPRDYAAEDAEAAELADQRNDDAWCAEHGL